MKAVFEVKFVSQVTALIEALVDNGYELNVKPISLYEDTPSERIVGYKVEVSKDESSSSD